MVRRKRRAQPDEVDPGGHRLAAPVATIPHTHMSPEFTQTVAQHPNQSPAYRGGASVESCVILNTAATGQSKRPEGVQKIPLLWRPAGVACLSALNVVPSVFPG